MGFFERILGRFWPQEPSIWIYLDHVDLLVAFIPTFHNLLALRSRRGSQFTKSQLTRRNNNLPQLGKLLTGNNQKYHKIFLAKKKSTPTKHPKRKRKATSPSPAGIFSLLPRQLDLPAKVTLVLVSLLIPSSKY